MFKVNNKNTRTTSLTLARTKNERGQNDSVGINNWKHRSYKKLYSPCVPIQPLQKLSKYPGFFMELVQFLQRNFLSHTFTARNEQQNSHTKSSILFCLIKTGHKLNVLRRITTQYLKRWSLWTVTFVSWKKRGVIGVKIFLKS